MRAATASRLVLLLAALTACSSDDTGDDDPGPLTLAAFDGAAAQTGPVATAVAVRPAVRVTRDGAGVAGTTVVFTVAAGGGAVTGGTVVTDAEGVARVGSWTLGTTVGANALTATATGVTGSVTFTATGTVGAAATIAKVAGADGQQATVGAAVTTRPSAKVTDAHGNPVTGHAVLFAVAAGGGAVTGAAATTDAAGIATVGSWTMGNAPGANGLTATATGLAGSPLTWTATAVVGPPAVLVKVAGDNQTAAVGTAVAIAPSVRVEDARGNLLATQAVTFAPTTGGGNVTGGQQVSGVNGVATVGSWLLGPVAGANVLTATAGAASITFAATGSAAFNPAPFAGTYNGTWTNTTFGSTGSGQAIVTVNGGASTATVTASATGNVLGQGGGAAPGLQAGAYTGAGANFAGVLPVMGTVTATINAAGQITASAINIPGGGITRWDATGTITATTIQMTFTVTFTVGAPATGTITLTKP